MKKKIYNVIIIIFASMMLASCCTEVNQIQSLGGGGDFTVINMGTNDTLKISGGINIGSYPSLTAHNGNVIKIIFEPSQEYSDYVFNTKYTLPNDEVVENQPEYEYVIGESLEGLYNIYLSAKSEGSKNLSQWNITAGGAFILNVVQ